MGGLSDMFKSISSPVNVTYELLTKEHKLDAVYFRVHMKVVLCMGDLLLY